MQFVPAICEEVASKVAQVCTCTSNAPTAARAALNIARGDAGMWGISDARCSSMNLVVIWPFWNSLVSITLWRNPMFVFTPTTCQTNACMFHLICMLHVAWTRILLIIEIYYSLIICYRILSSCNANNKEKIILTNTPPYYIFEKETNRWRVDETYRAYMKACKSSLQHFKRSRSIDSVHNELCKHRIIMHRDFVAGSHACLEAHSTRCLCLRCIQIF